MKRIAIEELARRVDDLAATTRKETVLLTRDGKPFAFVSDATNYDWEDIGYMTDPAFWDMVSEWRKDKTRIPLEVVEAQIAELERAERRKTAAPKSRGDKRKKAS